MEDTLALREKNRKLLLYVSIGSIVMLFAGLTSAFIVSKSGGGWQLVSVPTAFWFSTAAILLSSLSLRAAVGAIKLDKNMQAANLLLVTFALGLIFTGLQFRGWSELVQQNVFFAGKTANAAGSYIYVITGLHILHLVGGLIALMVSFFRSRKGIYKPGNYLGLKLTSTYWHFLDVLWVYLFLFLVFSR